MISQSDEELMYNFTDQHPSQRSLNIAPQLAVPAFQGYHPSLDNTKEVPSMFYSQFENKSPTLSGSSPPSSISSFEDPNAGYRYFPTDLPVNQINQWQSLADFNTSPQIPQQSNTSPSPTSLSPTFLLNSSSLYPPPDMTAFSRNSSVPTMQAPRSPDIKRGRGIKHSRDSMHTGAQVSFQGPPGSEQGTSTKRRRVEPNSGKGRLSGACTRCKRLKMKCVFAEDSNICSRCTAGNHECVVLGRKPRAPGLREILRKQIREKDAMIDTLLDQLNPVPSLTTPLSVIPSRLSLTPSQRTTYRDVLTWFEKLNSGARGDLKARIDVSFLEDGSDDDLDTDNESAQTDRESSNMPDEASQQPDFLPGASAPAGLLVTAALARGQRQTSPAVTRETSDAEESHDLKIEGGIGSKSYFQPGPSANLDLRRLIIERQAAPDILLSGLVTYDDVGKLFHIFFRWINPIIPVLDENIHTPAAVLGRCPFLFTVVCALASRYYDEKPDMYGIAMHLAKAAAANSFLDGWKTIEMCQAYVLLGGYTPPSRRWEEDRYWFYTGVGFRLAIELNLNCIPSTRPADERSEREVLNRIRTWIVCYIMDRCICINLGKPFMIPEDEVIRNAAAKFLGSKFQHPGDAYMVSLVELLRIMTRFSETVNPVLESRRGLKNDVDLVSLHKLIDDELTHWKNIAVERDNLETSKEPGQVMQTSLMQSVYQYCRLVTFSAGLQQVMRRGALEEDDVFFPGCLHAASAVVNLMLDGIIPTGFIRYSPEQVFALGAFATAVLMKCLRPEFSTKLDRVQEDRIIELVKRLQVTLDADQHAVDEQHITKRYARFLQRILGPHIAELETRRMHPPIPKAESEPVDQIPQTPGSSSPPALEQTLPHDEVPPVEETASSDVPQPPMDFGMAPDTTPWDSMFSSQAAVPIPPIVGYSDSDYLAAMMSFSDQMWYM